MDDELTLTAALKIAGIADTGGQAKLLIQSGSVRVNGEIATRRKRRVAAGDEIEVEGEVFVLELLDANADEDGDEDGR